MPSTTFTWTLAAAAIAVTQTVGGADLESLNLPAWVVAIAVAAALGARFVLYVREIASDKPSGPEGGGAAETEILILVRQGHEIQKNHLEELQLLRADLQESRNATREMVSCIRQYQQEADSVIAKVHRLHDAYFEGDEG